MGFIIWSLVSLGFIALGLVCFHTKRTKPIGFWANAEMFQANDVKAYHRALGKLWLFFGVALELLGLPLLAGQNSPLVMISVVGVMFLCIVLMAIYATIIEPKYKV